MSGQFKILESEQAELLKTFDRHLADVESHFTQNQTVSAERAYRCFFEPYDELKRKQTATEATVEIEASGQFRWWLRNKVGEKKKTLKWLVDQIRILGEI